MCWCVFSRRHVGRGRCRLHRGGRVAWFWPGGPCGGASFRFGTWVGRGDSGSCRGIFTGVGGSRLCGWSVLFGFGFSPKPDQAPAAVSGCLVWAGWCLGVWGGWVKVAFLFASLAMANEAARFHWLRCLVGGSLFCLLLASVVARLLVLVSVSSLPLFSLVFWVSSWFLPW